jgi:hypothetical protein
VDEARVGEIYPGGGVMSSASDIQPAATNAIRIQGMVLVNRLKMGIE